MSFYGQEKQSATTAKLRIQKQKASAALSDEVSVIVM